MLDSFSQVKKGLDMILMMNAKNTTDRTCEQQRSFKKFILTIRMKMMKFLGHTMKKVSLEILTLKRHSETKSSREKQLITNSMCEWMAGKGQRSVVMGWNLFKATKDRKLW